MCAFVQYNTPHVPIYQRLTYEMGRTSGASSPHGHSAFLSAREPRRLLHTKTTCGNSLGKGPSPDLKRSYGIISTYIGSLDLQNSSRNREILAAKMASAERDMCQDHSQAWMAALAVYRGSGLHRPL